MAHAHHPDPITMFPTQLVFSHWHLTEQYGNLLEAGFEEASLGKHANGPRLLALAEDLQTIENQIMENETFLRMAGLSDMEIYQ